MSTRVEAMRAERVAAVLQMYANRMLMNSGPSAELLALFLVDLRYYCERHGLDLEKLDRKTQQIYLRQIGRTREALLKAV